MSVTRNRPHPVFARCWERLSRVGEAQIGSYRSELVGALGGHVLELGAGNGLLFAHYPASVSALTAIEPEPFLRERAAAAAIGAPVPVTVRDGLAESLPMEDGSVDAVVACLVLCSVADPAAALAEARRVLRPGGSLRFFEHVHDDRPAKAAVQRGLDVSRLWPTLAGGCHCARDTVAAVRDAGFVDERHREVVVGSRWLPVNPLVLGTATRPA